MTNQQKAPHVSPKTQPALLPCPFCGANPLTSDDPMGATVFCSNVSNCRAEVVAAGNTLDEAINVWNTRARLAPDPAVPTSESLREAALAYITALQDEAMGKEVVDIDKKHCAWLAALSAHPIPQAAPTAEAAHEICSAFTEYRRKQNFAPMSDTSRLMLAPMLDELENRMQVMARALEASAHLAAGPGVGQKVMLEALALMRQARSIIDKAGYIEFQDIGAHLRRFIETHQDAALTAPAQPDTLIREAE